jgi:MFS family permease
MNAIAPSPPVATDSLWSTLRSFPRPVWVLFAGVFLNKFGTFVVPFLTIYLTRRGFTPAEAGVALGAYGLGRIAAGFLGGHLADTFGRRNTIVLSTVLSAVSMLLLSRADTLTAITLLTGLASFTGEMYVPACAALLTDLAPPGQRVTLFSAYRIAFNAGWALGPATAAFLASRSFTWLFLGDALSSLLFAGIAWTWLPRGARVNREAGWAEAAGVLRADRRFGRVLVATLFIGVALHQLVSTFGLHLRALGRGDEVYGALLSFNGLLVLVCELPLTRLTRRHSARHAMAVGYVLMGAGLAWNLMAVSTPALFAGMAILTLGEMVYAPVASAYVAGLAPSNMRGRYMGSWGMANSLSMALAPSLGMAAFHWSPAALWAGCGLVAVIAAVAIVGEPRPTKPVLVPA